MNRTKHFLFLGFTFLAPGFAQTDALPKDVNAETRSRLPKIDREGLDDRRKKALDAMDAPPQGVQAFRFHSTGTNAQFNSPMGWQPMQIAILTTAREQDQPFEWSLHEMFALQVGIEPSFIEIIKNRKPLTGVSERDAVIVAMGREIFSTHKLSSATYARALAALGKANLVDVAAQMGSYANLGALLTAFNQQLPPGWKQFLPLPFAPPEDMYEDSRSRLPVIKGLIIPLGSLYQRTLSPDGTGPAVLRKHGAGIKSLEASVGKRTIDLTILVTAREFDSQYDWTMNEALALKDGLEPAIIDAVRLRKPTAGLAGKDAALIEMGRELFRKHNVSTETYARVQKVFGDRDLTDLLDVMGQHASDAVQLITFDQHLPAGQKALLPIP